MSFLGTLAMWQATDPLTNHDMHLLMIFAGVIAGALFLQSLVIVVAALGGMKIQKQVMADIADVKAKALPMVDKVNALTAQITLTTADLTPTIKNILAKADTIAAKADIIAGHAEYLAALAREKADEFSPTISAAKETVEEANETVRDVNRKTQQQIDRVNGMVSSVLDATAEAGYAIKRAIQIPTREIGGLANGIKAAFGAMLNSSKPSRPVYPIQIRALPTSYRNLSDVPPDVLDEGIPGEPLH